MTSAKRAARAKTAAKQNRLNRDLARRRSDRKVKRSVRKARMADKISRAYKTAVLADKPKWKRDGGVRP